MQCFTRASDRKTLDLMPATRLALLSCALAAVIATQAQAAALQTAAGMQSGAGQDGTVLGRMVDARIPAQSLATALITLSQQAGVQIIAPAPIVAGVETAGIEGQMPLAEALRGLLNGSGLAFHAHGSSTVRIARNGNRSASAEQVLLELERQESESTGARPVVSGKTKSLSRVEVIGSNIRGVESISPTQVYDRGDMQRSGAQTTQAFIQNLPQNFSGGSNDALVRGSPYDTASSSNLSLGSSVNLRGLGSGATLVLVDGQRLALSSSIADFVDISLLPINALKRVQVLTDGASAIYGGDAVAGVVNFSLRDDFQGAESFVSYGDVTQGNSAEYRAGQTFGTGWETGNAMIAYDYHRRDPLSVLDKRFTRPIGIPIDLLPRQERHSAMGSINQNLGERADGWMRVLYSERDAQVTRANTATVATRTTDAFSKQTNVLGGVRGLMGASWDFDVSGVYSRVDSESATPTVPGAGVGNSRETMFRHWALEAKASGEMFRLPAGAVMAAVGTAHRRELFQSTNRLTGEMDRNMRRDVTAAFGEVLVPLADDAATGRNRLELSLSGRFEDYSDFGSSSNPKVGLRWAPMEGLNLRATYGTSFKPPNLGHLASVDTQVHIFTNDILNSLLVQHPEIPDPRPSFLVLGTGPSLRPETSTALTLGFDFHRALGGGALRVGASYYDIDFEDRINLVQVPGGAYNVYNIALSSPELLPAGTVVMEPSLQLVNELIERAVGGGGLFDQFGVYGGDPASVGMIAFIQLTNLAKTVTRGVDLDMGYRIDSDMGSFDFSLSGNYILEFSHQSSSATPMVDLVSTVFRPADYRLRVGASWTHRGWNSSVFLNKTGDTVDDRPMPNRKVPSYTTLDWYLGYATGEEAPGPLQRVRLDLGIDNVLDRAPPFIGNDFQFGILGYDPANADPIGRFISLKITKTW